MTEYRYRIRVSAVAEIDSTRPLNAAELIACGQQVATGNRPWAETPEGVTDGRHVPVEDIDVAILTPLCASGHVVDHVACSYSAEAPVHGSAEECVRLWACAKPGEHHDYVSPGWDDPSTSTEVPA